MWWPFGMGKKRREEEQKEHVARIAEAKQREFEQHDREIIERSIEEARIIAEHDEPLRLATPDYDLQGFPFDNREYITKFHTQFNRTTGEVVRSSGMFYADSDTLHAVSDDIEYLEGMLSTICDDLGIPVLQTETSSMVPLDSVSDDPPKKHTVMFLHPKTPTGKAAKYPVSVHFNASDTVFERTYDQDGSWMGSITTAYGSHGEISYLANGQIGKARILYHDRKASYDVKWKMAPELTVSQIEYTDNSTEEGVRATLYRI